MIRLTDKVRVFLYVATGSIITLAVAAVVYLTVLYLNSLQPTYLNFTYLQPIKEEPPTFHLAEPIPVEALFYNSSPDPLSFTALVFWTHGDKQILQFSFQHVLKPGCTELNFDNYPPTEVKEITQGLFAKGVKQVTWRIEGHNAVTKPYNGGLQPFRVEDATYVPDDQPLPERKTEDKLRCQ
jgi:hypothetical protein